MRIMYARLTMQYHAATWLLILLSAPVSAAPDPQIHVYVWDFSTRSGKTNKLTESLTLDFENALTEEGCLTVLTRRRYDRLLAQKQSEEAIRAIDGLTGDEVSELKTISADSVVFGDVYDDLESGELLISVSVQGFDSKVIASARSRLRRGLRLDSQTREKEMSKAAKAICKDISNTTDNERLATNGTEELTERLGVAMARVDTSRTDFRADVWEWPYTSNAYRGKVVASSSTFVVKADFMAPYSHDLGTWEYGLALFQRGDDCLQLLIRSDRTWRLIDYSPTKTMVLESGDLSSIATGGGDLNSTLIAVLGRHLFMTVNDERVGPIRLSETQMVGRSMLIVGFDEENPSVQDSIFSVRNIRLWNLPGEEFPPDDSLPTRRPAEVKVPPSQKAGKSGSLTSAGETKATGIGVFLKNFSTEAELIPDTPPATELQIGFIFRFTAQNEYFQITVDSNGRWLLVRRTVDSRRILDSGQLGPTVIPGKGPMKIGLVVRDGKGAMSIDSAPNISFELPGPYVAGDIAVVVVVNDGNGLPGTVRFKNFRAEKK